MTFTVALQVAITTPTGVEERVSVPTSTLTSELVQEINGKVNDLVSGQNQVQDEDVITASGSVASDEGGTWSISGNSTKAQIVAFSDFVNSVLNPPQVITEEKEIVMFPPTTTFES